MKEKGCRERRCQRRVKYAVDVPESQFPVQMRVNSAELSSMLKTLSKITGKVSRRHGLFLGHTLTG